MFASKLQIRLPRRITAYFLLFGVAALLWLSVGAVYVAHSVTEKRSESASLRSLGRASNRFALAYLRDKSKDLQPLLAEIRLESGADYCAIVSESGEYLEHSTPGYKGKLASEVGTVSERWDEILEVQYVADTGAQVREYRVPLRAGTTLLGTMRLGFAHTNLWGYVTTGAEYAPLAFIGPACCMAIGAVLVNRLVRPVADIEQQLYQVATCPSVESCELREVQGIGAAAMGWNRVVQQRFSAGAGGDAATAGAEVARTGPLRPTRCGAQQHSGRRGHYGFRRETDLYESADVGAFRPGGCRLCW